MSKIESKFLNLIKVEGSESTEFSFSPEFLKSGEWFPIAEEAFAKTSAKAQKRRAEDFGKFVLAIREVLTAGFSIRIIALQELPQSEQEREKRTTYVRVGKGLFGKKAHVEYLAHFGMVIIK